MNAVRTARPSSSIAARVGCFGPRVLNRRRICSASAVPNRSSRPTILKIKYLAGWDSYPKRGATTTACRPSVPLLRVDFRDLRGDV